MRAGILRVTRRYGIEMAEKALPPEHRIVAVRPLDDLYMDELFIEGPMMPLFLANDQEPDRVMLMVSNYSTYVECWWDHQPSARWAVAGLAL